MRRMMPYLLLLIGFVVLIKGADFLVTGGSGLAKRLNVSNLVIGLTIVAFGTSAPESVVTFFSAYNGASDLALTNIIGSVTTNVLLGLGIAAIIFPLAVSHGTVWKEIPLSLLAIVALGFLVNDQWGGGTPQLTWLDGCVLLLFFVIFLTYTFGLSKVTPSNGGGEDVQALPVGRSVAYVLAGLVALFLGGNWIVENAVLIANQLGVSEALIGLIVTGPGTSLPELAATAVAAKRRNVELAVGGVVGSNIFNIFFILGVSALVGPIAYNTILNIDMLLIFGASLLLFLALFVGKRHVLERWQGIAFLVTYVAYMVYLVIRG